MLSISGILVARKLARGVKKQRYTSADNRLTEKILTLTIDFLNLSKYS